MIETLSVSAKSDCDSFIDPSSAVGLMADIRVARNTQFFWIFGPLIIVLRAYWNRPAPSPGRLPLSRLGRRLFRAGMPTQQPTARLGVEPWVCRLTGKPLMGVALSPAVLWRGFFQETILRI